MEKNLMFFVLNIVKKTKILILNKNLMFCRTSGALNQIAART